MRRKLLSFFLSFSALDNPLHTHTHTRTHPYSHCGVHNNTLASYSTNYQRLQGFLCFLVRALLFLLRLWSRGKIFVEALTWRNVCAWIIYIFLLFYCCCVFSLLLLPLALTVVIIMIIFFLCVFPIQWSECRFSKELCLSAVIRLVKNRQEVPIRKAVELELTNYASRYLFFLGKAFLPWLQ